MQLRMLGGAMKHPESQIVRGMTALAMTVVVVTTMIP
jgi:hypothetical protein